MDPDIRQIYDDLDNENDEVARKSYQAYKELKRVPVDIWLSGLKDEDEEIREQAAYALGLTHRETAVELLLEALKDTCPSVRRAAAWSLGLLESPLAIEPLIAALSDNEWEVRYDAILSAGCLFSLVGNYKELILKAHFRALNDPESSVRARAAYSMKHLYGDGISEALLSALKDDAPEVRINVIKALSNNSGNLPQEAIISIIEYLSDSDKDIRIQIIKALGDITPHNKTAFNAIVNALHDPDPDIRATAADAINGHTGIAAAEALAALIDDEDPRVKACAVENIGYLGGESVYERLIGYLDDKSELIRAGAAYGFIGLDDKRAIDKLNKLFEEDPSPDVRYAALAAICNIDQDNKLDYLLRGLQDVSSTVREYASDKIDFSTDVRIIDPLVALLDDYRSKIRANAVWALGDIVEFAGYDEEDFDEDNPSEAVLEKRRLVDEKATESIINALDDVDDLVRGWALDALVDIRSERAIEHILKMAAEGDVYAQNALCDLKHPSMIGPYVGTDEKRG